MKLLKTMIISAVMLVMTGCTVVKKVDAGLTASQSAIATIAIKAGVIDLINKDPLKVKSTALKVVDITTDAIVYVSSDSAALITELDSKLTERIAKLDLSPEKQLLVDTLVQMIELEIKAKVTGNVLDADTVVIISKVLELIKTTAQAYE